MADFSKPKFIETNGLKMAVYEEGEGFPIVFCHGWPELAYSWRHQMSAVAQAGFHAIAPDQRGFGRSPHKGPDEDFDMEHLTADLIGLLDAHGIDNAVFCGHDWGGIIVWQLPLRYPDRVAGIIGVNTPYVPRPPIDPIEAFRKAFTDEMYIVQFNDRAEPEAPFDAHVKKVFQSLWRKGATPLSAPTKQPTFNLYDVIAAPLEALPGEEILGGEDLAYYVDGFTSAGFRGGINWYRNFTRNWQRSEHLPMQIPHPCLMITAENDRVLPPHLADRMKDYCSDLEVHMIKDCGHWTQAEKPGELNALLVDWMTRRFA